MDHAVLQPLRVGLSRFAAYMYWGVLKDQPYGVVIKPLIRGSVDALRQHCPAKRLTPMGLFAGESVRCFCGLRRRIAHIPLRVYMGVRKNTCKQALRLGLLTPPLSTAAYLYFAGKAQVSLSAFSCVLR